MKHTHILLEDVNLQFLTIRVRPRKKKIFELRAANLPKSAACNLPTQAEKKRVWRNGEGARRSRRGRPGWCLGRTAWANGLGEALSECLGKGLGEGLDGGLGESLGEGLSEGEALMPEGWSGAAFSIQGLGLSVVAVQAARRSRKRILEEGHSRIGEFNAQGF